MAGKKKQAQLTPEEKLQQALVPEAEQPYKVPANWCWTRQNIACYLSDIEKIVNGEHPYLEAKFLRGLKKPKIVSAGKFINKSSKVILVDGENSGEVFDIFVDGYMGSTFRLLCFSEIVYEQYCRYFIIINKEIYSKSKKGSAIPHLNKELFFNMPFPLPPLVEQQRIVERIESLFAKLDEAKENLQNVLDGFETRKAAILHKAFTGELTANWRKQHSVSMDSWEEKCVSEICKNLKYGTSKKSELNGLVAVIRMGNLQNGEIDWNNLAYTDDEEDIKKYSLKKGDVLFNRTNSPELVGKTAIYRGEFPAIYAGYLIKLDYNENIINGEYFNYLMNSIRAKEYCQLVKTDGVSQSNINAKKIGAFQIPVPKLEEQTEIVRIIDGLFAKEQQAKELAENVLAKIALIKKAILARAFRGELGTNNPADESAVELLKRVL